MNVVACQFQITWESPASNIEAVESLLEAAQIQKGSLIVLPEMFATGFSMNVDRIADEPSIKPFLAETARKYQSWMIGGFVTRNSDGRGLNQALLYGPNGTPLGSYNKIHPFSFSGEDQSYAPGSTIQTFDIGPFKLTPFVCYDLRFPEIFRTATRGGTHVFVVIANWPTPRTAHWTTLLRARAIENQAYVIGVNRTGNDPKLQYSGHSVIFNPLGETLGELDDRVDCLTTTIDVESLTQWRAKFPALQDIRPSFFP